MRVVAVVQARMSSGRLPGKILRNLNGRCALDYLLESLRHARHVNSIALATSTDASDDVSAAYAAHLNIECYRGSLCNVAQRLLCAGEVCSADAIVRINGDSPLLDAMLVDRAVQMFIDGDADLVTNVFPRSFPKGQSVEVILPSALRKAVSRMTLAEEREHVTTYFYSHPREFNILSFTAENGRPEVQLSIDDQSDFARCEKILQLLPEPPWRAGWRACVDAYDAIIAEERGLV